MAGRPGREPIRVLPVVDRVAADVRLDPYLTLRGLAAYSGIAPRTLRVYLNDAQHPLPAYQLGGREDRRGARLLFRVSEFDAWLQQHRRRPRVDVDRIVADVLGRKPA